MKIIVQAGGLGTRMKSLTASKPKALIAVQNKPILFHLFDAFPEADFIVVGDYKYDVLDRYISTFAKQKNSILIKAKGKGNAAGLREAVSYVPYGEPFIIIWSDLILPDGLIIPKSFEGCLIGTVNFKCSWGFIDGRMQKVHDSEHGIAGFYVFADRLLCDTLPVEGSFTNWLAEQTFPMAELPLSGCKDVGTLQAFRQLDNSKYRCRPYNSIKVQGEVVIKTGLTEEARNFVLREVDWYKTLGKFGFEAMPELVQESPMTLSRIQGQNLFLCMLNSDGKKATFKRVVEALTRLHSYEERPADSWDLYKEYFGKTLMRLQQVADAIPFGHDAAIVINGKTCINPLVQIETFRRAVLDTLMSTHYTLFHGDCQLTNTLVDEEGQVYFIDPRGYFGKSKIFGDPRYDWAKVYYAIAGNFDQFNVKNFVFQQRESGIEYAIGSSGWEFLSDELFNLIPRGEGCRKEIELIHAIIWMSMASHVWEDYDSMCVAFMNGIALFNKWLEDWYAA